MSSTAKVRLEGWLIKRKSKDRPTLFKNENLRWFRIQEVEVSRYKQSSTQLLISELLLPSVGIRSS